VPTVKRFHNCVLCIAPGDHDPPHFHIIMTDGRTASVTIAGLEVTGDVQRREIRAALEWAAKNRALLLARFEELKP
jgi:hypothetical protein